MDIADINFGVLDNRFLAKSVGILNPPSPICLGQDANLRTVLTLLKEKKIGAVILTDFEGKIIGIFSERDVILRVAMAEYTLETTVSEVMTPTPKTISMTTTVAFALQLMAEQGYRHLPIVDEDQVPIGMISVKDVIDYIAHSLTKALLSFDDDD
jgi:CBS domain-containing protein